MQKHIQSDKHLGRVAFISDIHGNIEALKEVLKDIELQEVDEIICLGDIVGYGPEPEACLNEIREKCSYCLKGNHDDALLTSPRDFNEIAAGAIYKIRKRMYPGQFANRQKKEHWDYLYNLPLSIERGPDLLVHGSPLDPLMDYILPFEESFEMEENVVECFEHFHRFLFVGHTHYPCVINNDFKCILSSEVEGAFRLEPKRKSIINVGSVGQPRDGDPRACYLLYDNGYIEWRRIEYNIQETMSRIYKLGLDESLAKRLQRGR